MQPRSVAGTAALNVVLSLALLIVGVGGGAAWGALNGPSPSSAATAMDRTNHIAAFTPTEHFAVGGVKVEEPPKAPAQVRRTVRRVVTQSGAATRQSVPSGAGVAGSPSTTGATGTRPAPGIGSGDCARLDDAKVNWLLGLVAKARSSNPEQAPVADRVEQQLNAAIGKNMCAEEAQMYLGNMCADASTRRFMGLMVKELPFFVRPMVGDPCKHDLVAAAEKYLP